LEDDMAKDETRIKGDLTTLEIKGLTDQLEALRELIKDTGATVLTPTKEWDRLRKEIALLNKKLNADTAAKLSSKLLKDDAQSAGRA
jgi:hypothetical protein